MRFSIGQRQQYKNAQKEAERAAERARALHRHDNWLDRELSANDAFNNVMDNLLWKDWDLYHP